MPWWCSVREPRCSTLPFSSVARGRIILRGFGVVARGSKVMKYLGGIGVTTGCVVS